VLVPADDGVAEICPLEFIDSAAGNPVALNEYGPLPPVAVTVAEYAVPATPFGSDVVEIESGALIVRLRLAVAVTCVGSVESVAVI